MKRIFGKEINKNVEKLCLNCKHFIGHFSNLPINHSIHGKCKLFGEIDLITGEIVYDHAKFVRSQEFQCGENGKLFVSRENDSKKYI